MIFQSFRRFGITVKQADGPITGLGNLDGGYIHLQKIDEFAQAVESLIIDGELMLLGQILTM